MNIVFRLTNMKKQKTIWCFIIFTILILSSLLVIKLNSSKPYLVEQFKKYEYSFSEESIESVLRIAENDKVQVTDKYNKAYYFTLLKKEHSKKKEEPVKGPLGSGNTYTSYNYDDKEFKLDDKNIELLRELKILNRLFQRFDTYNYTFRIEKDGKTSQVTIPIIENENGVFNKPTYFCNPISNS